MVYPMMVSLKLSKVLEGGDIMSQVLSPLINFGVIPFIAFGLGRYFSPEQPFYAMGLRLAALLPTSGMTILWAGFAGGNLGAAVKMTVLGLILGLLAPPFYFYRSASRHGSLGRQQAADKRGDGSQCHRAA